MAIRDAIRRAYQYNAKVGRNKIYWAIDLHDTIAHANYSNEMPPVIDIAIAVLNELKKYPETVLILFSSSYHHDLYFDYFKLHSVDFTYFNENPEIKSTNTGDFSKKFYYNVLIDDKAGFETDDWYSIPSAVEEYRKNFIV